MEKKYTVEELAKELKVSEKTILREIKKGNLKTEKAGRRHLIPEQVVKAYLGREEEVNYTSLGNFLKSNKSGMVSLLQKMVSMPSMTSELGQEEKLASFIKKKLDAWGIRGVIYKEGEAIAVRATLGFADDGFLLDAPLDIVPSGDTAKWSHPPFDGEIMGGRMYGRGTADAKAGIVTMLYTALYFKRYIDEESYRLEIVFDGGEQDGKFLGIKQVLKKGLPVQCGIIGYAGDYNDILVGARGYHRFEFTAHGNAVHTGSRYKPGINAISKMAAFICEVEKIKLPQSSDPLFSFGSRLTFSVIGGGKVINMVPDECKASIDVRTIPEITKNEVEEMISGAVEKIAAKDKDFSIDYVYLCGQEGYSISSGEKFVENLQNTVVEVVGNQVAMKASGPAHIGNLLNEYGIPMVVWGPKGENVHSYDEYVEIDSLPITVEIYTKTIMKYFGIDNADASNLSADLK